VFLAARKQEGFLAVTAAKLTRSPATPLALHRLQLIARVAGAGSRASEDPDAAGREGEEEGAAGGKGKRKQGKGKGGNALRGAGLAGLQLDPALLEGDFDPDKWDEQMAAAFNDDYYVSGWSQELPWLACWAV
jgi:hypothetical protein